MMKVLGLLLLLAGIGASGVAAQTSSAPDTSRPSTPAGRDFCYRPKRSPLCRSYLVFEVVATKRLTGTTSTRPNCVSSCTQPDLDAYLAWEVGWMANRDSSHSLGASL